MSPKGDPFGFCIRGLKPTAKDMQPRPRLVLLSHWWALGDFGGQFAHLAFVTIFAILAKMSPKGDPFGFVSAG